MGSRRAAHVRRGSGRLEAHRGWSFATVKTMLTRLAAKGAITHREDGRRFLYSPAIERDAYVGSELSGSSNVCSAAVYRRWSRASPRKTRSTTTTSPQSRGC